MAPQLAYVLRASKTKAANCQRFSDLSTLTLMAPGDPTCQFARGSDALFARKSCPNSLSVSALIAVAPPRLSLLVSEVAARVKEGTRRGQRPVSAMSLPAHPAVSPATCSFANKTGPAPRSLWVGLRVDSRGGSDAPYRRKRRPNSGRRLSPAGTSLPPRSSS
jgi:hypothetical protein